MLTGFKDENIRNGIALAVERDDAFEIFEFFQNGQSVEAADVQGLTLLQYAVLLDKPKAAAELLKLGANPHVMGGPSGYTALHVAVYTDNINMIDILIQQGQANVAVRSEGLFTPLHLAVFRGKRDAVERLIHHGADPEQRDGQGNNAFDIIQMKLLECTNDRADIEPYVAILELLNKASGQSAKIISLPEGKVRPAKNQQENFLKIRASIKGAPGFDF